MLCPNCKKEIRNNNGTCTICGAALNAQTMQQPAYAAPGKKKRGKGGFVVLVLLLAVAGAAAWFAAPLFGLTKPKDLNVRYTEADYKSAIEKVGLSVTFNGITGEQLEQNKKNTGKAKLNINDYDWKFSDFQDKTFTLTPVEATALLNEIAPGFWWFDNLQVNILPDGTMQGSSTADIAKLKNELYSDVANKVPVPLPNRTNLYGEGRITITDGTLTCDPGKLYIGEAPVPQKYLTGDNLAVATPYFERLYNVVPGFEIHSLTADENGKFIFDGKVPQKVEITQK